MRLGRAYLDGLVVAEVDGVSFDEAAEEERSAEVGGFVPLPCASEQDQGTLENGIEKVCARIALGLPATSLQLQRSCESNFHTQDTGV